MGRGRQKAKDAKIARELKYTSHNADITALERELVSGPSFSQESDEDDFEDRWAPKDD